MLKLIKIVIMIGSKYNPINKVLYGMEPVHILIILLNINLNFSSKYLPHIPVVQYN